MISDNRRALSRDWRMRAYIGQGPGANPRLRSYVKAMTMNARPILALVLTLLALPAQAEKLSLSAISDYLNSLTTAEARFTQLNDDGSRSAGNLQMLRPGRIRFEYDAPDESLVIAGQGLVAVFDANSNEPPQKFQLANTPLKLILQSDVDLTRERLVVGHEEVGNDTVVTAQDPEHPEYGSLRIYFAKGPSLRGWTLVDGSGAQTSVVLEELETGMRIPARFFDLARVLEERGFD